LFATLGTISAIGLGMAGWLLMPAKYTTYALVYVAPERQAVIPSPADATGQGQFATLIKGEATKIKSTGTMRGAMRDPVKGIGRLPMLAKEEDPAAFLEEKILTEMTDTNPIIKVALSGDDPVQVTKIVNAVVDYYVESEKNSQQQQYKKTRLEILQKMKDELRNQLNSRLKSNWDRFGPPPNSERVGSEEHARLNQFANLQLEKTRLPLALEAARARLKQFQDDLEQFDAKPVEIPDLTKLMDADKDIAAKKYRVSSLERSMEAQLSISSLKNGGPPYERLKQLRAAAVAELDAEKRKFQALMETNQRKAERVKYVVQVEAAQNEVRGFEVSLQLVNKQVDELKGVDGNEKSKVTPEKYVDDDDIAELRGHLEHVDKSIYAFTTELTAPDRVYVYQPAEIPTKSDIKKQLAVTGFGGVFGLGLVGGCISLYELRRKRVYGPKDPVFRRLPLLGCVPDCELPATMTARADGQDIAGQAFFEAVDKVKTVVCRQMQRKRMQALLVTSAVPGEGKSILAWHLAMSLARTDKRTLFIDGNLRNPGLHNHFDIASHPGLSEQLRGDKTMPEVVQRTALANLWCIAAGVCDEQARQALDKDALRRLLERARNEFDCVIIDTCSIREAVDPLYLAQQVDATVLSVRTFHSSTTDVERARQRLAMLGTPLLGAVLTDATGAGCEL
jgi:capsular exopolysaccharide synthesis family protein